MTGVVGIFWISVLAYFLNQNVASLQNLSLEQIIQDNILLNIFHDQIQFLSSAAKLCLILNIGRFLKLWNIARFCSFKIWCQIKSRPLSASLSLSKQKRKVIPNDYILSPTPESKNVDAPPPQPPPQPSDIDVNSSNSSTEASQPNNEDVNDPDPDASSQPQPNDDDDNNPPPIDTPVTRLHSVSRPAAVRSFISSGYPLLISLQVLYFCVSLILFYLCRSNNSYSTSTCR